MSLQYWAMEGNGEHMSPVSNEIINKDTESKSFGCLGETLKPLVSAEISSLPPVAL